MKKKSLLLAISAMSIAAIGVGTVGTFAWYTATANANAHLAEAAMTGTVTGSASSLSGADLYAKFQIQPQNEATKLTSIDGYTYAIVNGYLRDADEGELNTRYGVATLSFLGWYQEAACSNPATAAQLASIAANTPVLFKVGGNATTRLRVANVAPTVNAEGTSTDGSFGKVFGDSYNSINVTATFAAGGATCTFSGVTDAKVYYAISGEETLKLKSAIDTNLNKNSGFTNDGAADSITATLRQLVISAQS